MNHLGDTNKMVDTPRMNASAHDDGAIWQTGCDLEHELNAANERIKRLDDIIKHQEKVIKRLEDVEYRLMQERITD